jgi:hypothetical protein
VTIVTLIVSGFGYVREALLADHFGVSSTMDAYFGAIFVPSNLYLILVVGTLSPVFIPLILQEGGTHDPARVSETVSAISNFVFVMLGGGAAGLITIRYWLPMLFPGFDAATTATATRLTYIILPAVVFFGPCRDLYCRIKRVSPLYASGACSSSFQHDGNSSSADAPWSTSDIHCGIRNHNWFPIAILGAIASHFGLGDSICTGV